MHFGVIINDAQRTFRDINLQNYENLSIIVHD